MSTKDKWKRFALEMVLLHHNEGIAPEALYDLMETTEDADLEDMFKEHDAHVWRMFNNMPLIDVTYLITELADHARWVANNE